MEFLSTWTGYDCDQNWRHISNAFKDRHSRFDLVFCELKVLYHPRGYPLEYQKLITHIFSKYFLKKLLNTRSHSYRAQALLIIRHLLCFPFEKNHVSEFPRQIFYQKSSWREGSKKNSYKTKNRFSFIRWCLSSIAYFVEKQFKIVLIRRSKE